MPLDLTAILSELVATPSVNPMGRDVSGPEFFEYRLTDYLEQFFVRLAIPTFRQAIAPKRDNLIARLEGDVPPESGGKIILLEAHQDTVPADGMTVPPFEPQVRDGRLYGRGACDIKGGMTAMLGAVARLVADQRTAGGTQHAAEQHPHPGPLPEGEGEKRARPTIIIACTVNEEHGFTGATGLCKLWSERSNPLLPRKPDAAIVAEPTNLQIVVAHKGMVRWRSHTRGRAAHSSQPELGENAVYRMARVVAAIERYGREVVRTLANHPLCGQPTISVGTIRGGISVNTVPDRCTIEIDRRLAPGEDPQTAWQQVVDFVACETGLGQAVEHEPPFMQSRGLGDTNNRELAAQIGRRGAGCYRGRGAVDRRAVRHRRVRVRSGRRAVGGVRSRLDRASPHGRRMGATSRGPTSGRGVVSRAGELEMKKPAKPQAA